MGIKEFEHLKKSLSEIKSKSSRIKDLENKLDHLQDVLAISREESEIIQTTMLKWQKELRWQQDRMDKIRKPDDKINTELYEIREEIYKIEAEMVRTNKRTTMRNTDFIAEYEKEINFMVLLWFMIPLVLAYIFGYVFLDSGIGFFTYCFMLPILIPFILKMLFKNKLKSELLDGETIKQLESLKKKENEINRTIKDYKSEINRLEGFRKREQGQIDRNQNVLIKIENTLGSIKDTEQLIEKLNKDIEETYESIKHLIPFSDYL